MRKIVWILCLTVGFASAQDLAQEQDSVSIDTVEVEPPPYYLGVYLKGGISLEPSIPNHNIFSVLGVGLQYERWILGFSRNDFQGSVQSFVIFPNTFELKYRYGGVAIAYQLYQKNWVNFLVKAGYYQGDMVWRNQEDGQNFLRDEFNLMKLGVVGEIEFFRYVKPQIWLGYQKMNNLDLSRVRENDFSGLFVAVGIRMGYFNQ